jgi:hypothetical protein
MIAVSPLLFEKLVGKRLGKDVESVLATGRQGFDVRVETHETLVEDVFERLLLRASNEEFHTVHIVRGFVEFQALRHAQMNAQRYEPIVLLGCGESLEGAGLVVHTLPDLVDVLPAAPTAIKTLLAHHGLEVFLGTFTPERVRSLKPLLERGALSTFVDAVVQVAYLEGACGDAERSELYLRGLRRPVASDHSTPLSPEAIARVLQWCLERGPSPHVFLKCLLTHYAVEAKGLTHVQASQSLGISRTTLQLHLRVGEKHGVAEVFAGFQKGCGRDSRPEANSE